MEFNDKPAVNKAEVAVNARESLLTDFWDFSPKEDSNANGLLDHLEFVDLLSLANPIEVENIEKNRESMAEAGERFRYLTGIELTAAVSLAAFALGRLTAKPSPTEKETNHDHEAKLEKTKNKEAEEEQNEKVQAKEERISENKESEKVLICTIDTRFNFVQLSNSLFSAWGYKAEELYGRNVLALVDNESLSLTLQALQEIVHAKSGLAFENKMRHKNGQWMHISWSAYWSAEDNQIIGIAHDITNKKLREQRRQEAVQMVSHDLRSPLTSIQFSLELLAAGASGQLPEEALQDVLIAQNNTSQLINLVNDLLDLEKLEHGSLSLHLDKIPLADIVQSALDSVRFLARRKKIEINVPDTNLSVLADKERIVQVLINILSNAINYAPEQTTITLKANIEKNFVEVQVNDQGPGIPAQYQQEIFERFRQAAPTNNGLHKATGLGLAICKSIIEGHHGTIGVNSEQGQGSTFWFKLPAAEHIQQTEHKQTSQKQTNQKLASA